MTSRRFDYALSLAILLALPASAQAGGHVASATGVKQVNGTTVYVDVVVAVPAGQTARHATDRALSEQGAFAWEEFRQELIAQVAAAERRGGSFEYYEVWLATFERLLADKGLVSGAEVEECAFQFEFGERDEVF